MNKPLSRKSIFLSPGNPPSLLFYPRARGADGPIQCRETLVMPLPPRTRGRLHNDDPSSQRHASTPAHAGPTPRGSRRSTASTLYPRARGADPEHRIDVHCPLPLPPRTRGRPTRSPSAGRSPSLYPRARGADLLSTVEILRHPSSRAPLLIHSQPIGPLRHEPHAVQDDRAGNRPIEDDGEMSSTARLAGIGAD